MQALSENMFVSSKIQQKWKVFKGVVTEISCGFNLDKFLSNWNWIASRIANKCKQEFFFRKQHQSFFFVTAILSFHVFLGQYLTFPTISTKGSKFKKG